MSPAALLIALVPLAWLVPNHYVPWMSAWSEGWALALTGAAWLCLDRPSRLPAAMVGFVALATVSVVGQWAIGRLYFGGDAIVVLLYLAAVAAAVAAGAAEGSTDALALGTLMAALASVGVALAQWLGHPLLGVFGMALPPGERPWANLGQPNLLCSALFLGVCAAAALCERGRIGRPVLALAGAMLAAGITMTASRTGWLQGALLLVLAGVFRHRAALRVTPRWVAGYGLLLALMWAAWPALDAALQLSAHRDVAQQFEAGVRLPYWRAMLDAVAREPLAGYGWLQTAIAQWTVALDHPPIQRHFEQSHNLVLELVLWAGVPVGLALAALAAALLWVPLRRCRDGAAVWLLAGVAGVGLHALVEYPLHFAHLLLPAALFLGAGLARLPPGRGIVLPQPLARVAALAWLAVFGFVARDYLEAEQNERLLLQELARIGTTRVESPPPNLPWLTQLGAFLAFVRTEPHPGMSEAELAAMHRTALRFGYAPSIVRWARAAALNGRPDEAQDAMQRLCSVHSAVRCAAARERWAEERAHTPALPPLRPPGPG